MDQTGTIGIVGGGQLGRMLTEAALKLGFKVIVVDPNENCPAAQVGAEQIAAAWDDKAALRKLAEQTDVITIEVEHVDAEALEEASRLGKPVHPSPATVALIQDKYRQKEFLREAGIPTAEFKEINNGETARKVLQDFDGKMLVKTRRNAYDGRGNMVVTNMNELEQALERFEDRSLYAEKFVPFRKELAIMVARGRDGSTVCYPVTETIHERNICLETLTPAEVDLSTAKRAEEVALSVAQHLEGAGVYGIEMFLTEDGEILVNEVAPRVHNSGHYTIEACETSQFEQHIRAVTDMPLGPTKLIVPAAVMINILGERNGPAELEGLEEAAAEPHTTVYIYGKSQTKVDRKMGHITATGDTIAEARKRAERARAAITI